MTFKNLIKDPPPEFVFELSEAGLAHAQGARVAFGEFPPETLKASPSEDNLLKADAAGGVVSQLAPPNGAKKRRRAAVLLPDAAARVAVLDFDVFPDSPAEQLSLVRFRVKRTIPFDIDAAAVSFPICTDISRRASAAAEALIMVPRLRPGRCPADARRSGRARGHGP